MKQFFVILLALVLGAYVRLEAQQTEKAPSPYQSLESSSPVLNMEGPEAMWDIEFNYEADNALGFASLAGALYFGEAFWVSQWNSETLFSLDSAGNPIDTFTVATGPTNLSGTRSLTADDTSIYIANNTTTIHQIDPATRSRIGAINTTAIAGQGIRFATYDPSANNGNGGFWVGNFNTDIRLISRTGAVLQTITAATHGLGGMYGAAYDGQSLGGPYLWVFHQSNGPSSGTISALSLLKGGLPTGEIRDASADLTMTSTELAGGLFISDDLIAGKRILGGMLQSGNLFGYDLDLVVFDDDAVGVSVAPSPAYTKVPEVFAVPVGGFKVAVLNQGITDPMNIDVTISVDSAGNTVYSGMTTTATNVPRYGRDTVTVGGTFSPIGKGNYEIVATATAPNGTEDDPSDDRTTFPYSVTDSVYSRDTDNFNSNYNFFARGYAGAVFDIPNTAYIKGVEVVLGTSANQVGDTIYAVCAAVTGGFPDNFLALRGKAQIVTAGKNTYLLEFPVSLPVTPNTQWLFGIYKSDSISIAATTDYYEPGYNFFSGAALGWAPSGVASTRFIRPIIATCDGFRLNATSTPDNGTGNGSVSVSLKGASGAVTFQWDDPNNSTSPSVTGLAAGTYRVTVTDQNGCSGIDSVTVGSNVSIEDELALGIQKWELFPNPTNGIVQAKLMLNQPTEVSWEVLDLMGKVIQQSTSSQNLLHEKTFDLSQMASGVYVVKVHTALGTAHKTLVLK